MDRNSGRASLLTDDDDVRQRCDLAYACKELR
jgi:hypothetical protein